MVTHIFQSDNTSGLTLAFLRLYNSLAPSGECHNIRPPGGYYTTTMVTFKYFTWFHNIFWLKGRRCFYWI